jgi:hypothetical protein
MCMVDAEGTGDARGERSPSVDAPRRVGVRSRVASERHRATGTWQTCRDRDPRWTASSLRVCEPRPGRRCGAYRREQSERDGAAGSRARAAERVLRRRARRGKKPPPGPRS